MSGAGKDNVSRYFKDACDVFINVEQIHKAKSLPSKELPELKKLVKLINAIIDQNSEGNEYVPFSRVVEQLKLKDKQFNPKNYGAPNNKVLPFFQTKLNNHFSLVQEKTTWKIKKIQHSTNSKDNYQQQAIDILNNYYKNNKPAVVQKLRDELKKGINNFTFKLIGEKQMKTFLSNNGYKVSGNTIKRK